MVKTSIKRFWKSQSACRFSHGGSRRLSTSAGHFVARRYRVRPAFADLIANLADLGSEVR
jgi:hypothetical protein